MEGNQQWIDFVFAVPKFFNVFGLDEESTKNLHGQQFIRHPCDDYD